MIQSVKTTLTDAYQSVSECMPSKKQIKTAIKITAIASAAITAVIAAVVIGIDNYRHEDFSRSRPDKVDFVKMPGVILENVNKDGISFLKPENFSRVIGNCGFFRYKPPRSSFSGCDVYNYEKGPWSINRLMIKAMWLLDLTPVPILSGLST